MRTVYIVTDRAELAGLVDDLEHCAYYYPPLLASELHHDFARRNCEAARGSGPLTRDERRAMAEEDFELWTRLAVCAANLDVEGARRFADMMFDELLAKGLTEKQELIYARYLACCPGREQQALDYVEELRKRGTSGELAYIAAWAKVWMGDADGAIKGLQDRTEAESVALRGAVESNKASIQARSRYLVESRPEIGK